MIRLCVREFVEEHAPKLTMTEVGRRANIAQRTMIKIWKHPENIHVEIATLEPIAKALSEYLGHKVTVMELLEDSDETSQ